MLELREYNISELSQTLNTNGKQATERKLKSWGINYTSEGYGSNLKFSLLSFDNEFKVYCILELGFDSHSDFDKLREFFYYYLNDDEFMTMPFEVKQTRLEGLGITISRQTISNWEGKLERKGFIGRSTSDFIYYFAYKHNQIITDRATYSNAWKDYWYAKDYGTSSEEAMLSVIGEYGGVPRKAPKAEVNGIYLEELSYITAIVSEGMT